MGCTGLYWAVLGCNGLYLAERAVLGSIVSHLPGGHLPPPKKNFCQEDSCHPQFFFFSFFLFFLFLAHFFGFFDLQLMEDIKDGKEEVLDEVVMEHIK